MILTCHSNTLHKLLKQVCCCELHYGVKVDLSKIKKPMPPCINDYRVSFELDAPLTNRCPIHKICED